MSNNKTHFEVTVDRFPNRAANEHTSSTHHKTPTATPPSGAALPAGAHNIHASTLAAHTKHTVSSTGYVPPTPKGLCIFDIDNTLTRGPLANAGVCGAVPMKPVCHDCVSEDRAALYNVQDRNMYAASYAKQAIAHCKAKGFGVVVATGEHCAPHFPGDRFDVNTRLSFLKELGFGSDVVREGKGGQLLVGPSLQCANAGNGSNKAVMVKKLLEQSHTPANKAVFWDDNTIYRHQVRTIPGVTVSHASSACGGGWCPTGCGISKENYKSGMAALKKAKH